MSNMESKEAIGLRLASTGGGRAIDLSVFEQLVADGYVNQQTHPEYPLRIWNYSSKTQFESMWTYETIQCRGLITDLEGNVVGRPFRKFWNLEEHYGPLPDGPYEVWEKVDGSLGILYHFADEWHFATRGSFRSDQAQQAKQIAVGKPEYHAAMKRLDTSFTWLFEIIYPENRIVVDYKGESKLVLLGAIHTADGYEMPPSQSYWPDVATFFSTMSSKDNPLDLKLLETDNKEGFVLRYTGSGLRLKIKFNEYLRLHRLLTNVNAKNIWELLRSGSNFKELLDKVPDEFYRWVKRTADELQASFDAIEAIGITDFKSRPDTTDRATFARYAKSCKYPHVLFAMYDGKVYDKFIWDLIKPLGNVRPFAEES